METTGCISLHLFVVGKACRHGAGQAIVSGPYIAIKSNMIRFKIFKSCVFLLLSLSTVTVLGSADNFDSCVDSLYGMGGLSKAEARKLCLPRVTQQILDCQNKRFLIDGLSPLDALSDCQQYPESFDLKNYSVYRGVYEPALLPSPKQTVCSMTVNSSDERDAFRRKLNPDEYNWVELLPTTAIGFENRFIPRDNLWFKRACQQRIKCDIMVISGHFASTFLGSSGFEIKLEDLTKNSCDENCNDLFLPVKEVYLFGCNTLAERSQDSRTIDSYRNILVEDGVSPHQAQRIAARRYTNYGQTIKEEIRKVFPNAKSIFGFSGPGPKGPTVKPELELYLNKAYAPGLSNELAGENFRQTLAQKGMLRTTGLAKDSLSCQQPQRLIRNSALQTEQGLREYIEKYAKDIPVAAFDLLAEALQRKIIDEKINKEMGSLILTKINHLSVPEQRTKICPLLMTEFALLVPKELKCTSDLFWL